MTSGSLWNYYRDEINDDVHDRDQLTKSQFFWGKQLFKNFFEKKAKS